MGTVAFSRSKLFGLAVALGLVVACASSPPPPGPPPVDRPSRDGHGMVTPYTVTLRYFSDSEALTIVSVMSKEFPGYRSHNLISKSAAVRHYEYLTTAKAFKLEEWLYVLFSGMGLDSERDVLIQVDGINLVVDKLAGKATRPVEPSDRPRFR